MEEQFRKLSSIEESLIKRLLSADFPGRKEVSQQLENCLVRVIDTEGSLEIQPNLKASAAIVEKTIPVEAEAPDEDGIHMHFLLFVRNGYVKELEIYKDDGSPIRRLPAPEKLEIIVLPG
jgi:Domain of unknown function (DUF6984)